MVVVVVVVTTVVCVVGANENWAIVLLEGEEGSMLWDVPASVSLKLDARVSKLERFEGCDGYEDAFFCCGWSLFRSEHCASPVVGESMLILFES